MNYFKEMLIAEIHNMNQEIFMWIDNVLNNDIFIYPLSEKSMSIEKALKHRGKEVRVLRRLSEFDNCKSSIIITGRCTISQYVNAVMFFLDKGVAIKNIISNRDYNYYNLIRMKLFKKINGYGDLYKFVELNNREAMTIIDNIDHIEEVYNSLSDNKSKITYLRVIIKRLLICPTYMDIYSDNQYFTQDIIRFGTNETFLDVGSYDGDTIKCFVSWTQGIYNEIIAIEPDNKKFSELVNNTEKYHDITYLNVGLAAKTEKIEFQSLESGCSQYIFGEKNKGYNSKLILKGDSLMMSPTYIKMDIEGAEKNALAGLDKTIKCYAPKMAICIYHKLSDLWEIPTLLSKYYNQYSLYIRHHSNSFSETVCYLVPKE